MNNSRILRIKNAKFSGYYFYVNWNIQKDFQICISVPLKPKIFFEDISSDVERWFDTCNYNENDKRPPPIGQNKKIPGLFKDELGGKIMVEIVALRPKT